MEETFKLVNDTYFSHNQGVSSALLGVRERQKYDWLLTSDGMLGDDMWNISFFKAVGPDGIFPELLQSWMDLLSLLLNTTEREQHTYVRGRSVETALHNAINLLEKSLHRRLYKFGVNRTITDWIDNMLSNR